MQQCPRCNGDGIVESRHFQGDNDAPRAELSSPSPLGRTANPISLGSVGVSIIEAQHVTTHMRDKADEPTPMAQEAHGKTEDNAAAPRENEHEQQIAVPEYGPIDNDLTSSRTQENPLTAVSSGQGRQRQRRLFIDRDGLGHGCPEPGCSWTFDTKAGLRHVDPQSELWITCH